MIFVDTSAIYALADAADPNHENACEDLARALDAGEMLLVHNYIVVESLALIHHRLGNASAAQFLHDLASFEIHWIDADIHSRAVALFVHRKRRKVSFVDCVSFLVVRDHHIRRVLAFDEDFEREGFSRY